MPARTGLARPRLARPRRPALLARAPAGLRGLLLDKDGTLFDFQASWGGWAAKFVRSITGGDPAKVDALAGLLGLDLATRRFDASSPVIAGTMEVVVEAVHAVMPETDEALLRAEIAASTAAAEQVPVAPLVPLLERLAAAGLALGVATNDGEGPTRAHLERAGILDRLDFVAGYDSGFGAKPGPGMGAGFCRALGLAPAEAAMVGDSTHDLVSARAAGLCAVAVLSGPARADELAPHADAVLPDIAALPDWLGLGAAAEGDAAPGRAELIWRTRAARRKRLRKTETCNPSRRLCYTADHGLRAGPPWTRANAGSTARPPRSVVGCGRRPAPRIGGK